jgi:heavy metal sensor kinase
VAILALSMSSLAFFLYLGQANALLEQVDSGIREIAATEARTSIRDFLEGSYFGGEVEEESEFMLRLLTNDGTLIDGTGAFRRLTLPERPTAGIQTMEARGEADWRVYTLPVELPDGSAAWMQAGRSLAATEQALARLRRNLLLGLPLVLLVAGIGGLFLAGRALAPIDRMAATAERISGSDLSGRMGRQNSEELGRLAASFDSMLERLEQAFSRERRFVADVSHELRTPLTALKGRIEVTLSRPRSTGEYASTLEELQAEVDRLTRLSNDLLMLARFDRGALPSRLQEVDLSVLLREVSERIRPLARSRDQVVEEQVQPGLLMQADPDQLVRLFFNLLDNAVKFTGKGGRIVLRSWRRDGLVEIEVSDSGPGVSPEHLDRIFDRFYRVEESRARSTGGHGLGLSIAQEITKAHGGALSARSMPGEGTTFTVRLPA